jgi:hypothetical protein
MELHDCDIFDNCARCPIAFCPYEKLDPDWLDGMDEQEELDEMDEDEDDGW